MIRIGDREIAAVRMGERAVMSVYLGAVLVWQSIRSCFGSGVWAEGKPWMDSETWKE